MRVYFPKKMLNEEIVKGFEEMGYRVVEENGEFAVFEGVFSLKIPCESLKLNLKQFAQLCRMIKVEGGRRSRVGGTLSIAPHRNRRFTIRLSDDEYEALVKVAEDRGYAPRNLSTFFRSTLLLSLSIRLEQMGKI